MKHTFFALGVLTAMAATAMPKLSGNLRNYDAEKAAFLKEIAAETNVDKRATLQLAYAKFEFASAKDDKPQQWRDAQVKAYETAGLKSATKLEMLKSGVWSKDYETDGWKIVENEPKLQWTYFNRVFDLTRYGGAFGVEEKDSSEHRLAVAEKAMKYLKGQELALAKNAYAETLGRLERYDEQEKALRDRLGEAVKADTREAAYAYGALGGFYRMRAQRYYDDPDEALLRRALDCYENEIKVTLRYDCRVHFWQNVIGTAFELKDYDAVERHLKECVARMTARNKGKFGPDATVETWAGDLCYFRGDYEGAVKHYSSVPNLATRPVWNENGRSSWDRYAESLYALGRYEECLKVVPKLCSWCSLADRNNLYKRVLQEKVAAQKAK